MWAFDVHTLATLRSAVSFGGFPVGRIPSLAFLIAVFLLMAVKGCIYNLDDQI